MNINSKILNKIIVKQLQGYIKQDHPQQSS